MLYRCCSCFFVCHMLYLLPLPVPVCGMTGNKLVSFHYLACETLLSAPTAYQEEIFVAFLVPSKIFSSRHGLFRPVTSHDLSRPVTALLVPSRPFSSRYDLSRPAPSVSDPYSSNPDPDTAKNLNPDPERH